MTPLWFWRLDGLDTGAFRRIGGIWCATGEVDLRGAIFAGGPTDFHKLVDKASLNWSYGKFASQQRSYDDVVLVQDHLRNQMFMQSRTAVSEPIAKWTPADHDAPDDTFHRCDKCNEALANAHPMDVSPLCAGCAHNKEVIERLNKLADEYF